MGASDSKLVFKQGIFKLSETKNIPADDQYWTNFWVLPESAEDIFTLLSPADVRRIRDDSLSNLETLLLALTSRLFALRNSSHFPSPEIAPERDALNCIRVLTRLLPYIYEAEHLEKWEEKFFWTSRRVRTTRSEGDVLFEGDRTAEVQIEGQAEFEEGKPLAQELIDTLVDLLFFNGFTLPPAPSGTPPVRLAIWQSGVGCNSSLGSTKELESNRMEVLKLLLTLTSKSMYTSQGVLPVQGIPAITYMATLTDKHVVLTLLCSLLNTALKYNPATWHVPYDHVMFKDSKQVFITHCLQILLVLVLYPVPEGSAGVPPRNTFRHFLGKLHRAQDFQFIIDGMTRILNQPLQATSSYLPGSQKSVTWAPEMIMLFWELLQCNKRFRSFIIETDRCHDFVVLILFHAISNKNDNSKQGSVRMCIFVLQTLSVEANFGARLNKAFSQQGALPIAIRIPNFKGSYVDFLVVSIHTLITTSSGKLEAVYPALLAIINNIAPHVIDLSLGASTKLMQLFANMSSAEFLFANESNHLLLKSLLEAFNAMIENQHQKNPALLLAMLKAQKRFIALRELMVNGGEEGLQIHAQRRKEAAEQESLSNSRRSSTADSLRSPSTAQAPSLSDVPEVGDTFTIGDDEESDEGSDEDKHHRQEAMRASVNSLNSAASSTAEDAMPRQLRGMSEKARGKMPASRPAFSRTSSAVSLGSLSLNTTPANGAFEPTEGWLTTWLPDLPLHTCLSTVQQVETQVRGQTSSSTATEAINTIRGMPLEGLEASTVRVHLFEWSPLSIGWYESLLWSFVYVSEVLMTKGAPSVWRGTTIRLFRVQEGVSAGPTLTSPRGAVDAVGSNLIQRIGNLGLNATPTTTTGGVPRARNEANNRIRDV